MLTLPGIAVPQTLGRLLRRIHREIHALPNFNTSQLAELRKELRLNREKLLPDPTTPNLKSLIQTKFTVHTVEFSRVADTSQYQVWDFIPPSPRAYSCSQFQFKKQRVILTSLCRQQSGRRGYLAEPKHTRVITPQSIRTSTPLTSHVAWTVLIPPKEPCRSCTPELPPRSWAGWSCGPRTDRGCRRFFSLGHLQR
jgi:hypothetical protein